MDASKTLEIHSHSTVSDGEYAPEKMAELMADHGVDLWALSDHDTAAGCQRAKEAASAAGVDFVPAIEISASDEGSSIHVLGYGFEPGAGALCDYADEMVEARRRRMKEMVERMCELGYEVELDDVVEVSGGGNLGRPHLAKALVKRGHVDEIQKAFDRWLSNNGPAYVAMARPSVPEAIEMITDAGGMAVLAHPGRYGDISHRLQSWREAGLWGLEVRHPSHNQREEQRLIRVADRLELATTASNDWHGHAPQALERLGKVRFPDSWQQAFFDKLEQTKVGIWNRSSK